MWKRHIDKQRNRNFRIHFEAILKYIFLIFKVVISSSYEQEHLALMTPVMYVSSENNKRENLLRFSTNHELCSFLRIDINLHKLLCSVKM